MLTLRLILGVLLALSLLGSASVYTSFGIAAFLARDMNAHFLLFVASGILLGLHAAWRDPVEARR